MRDDGNMVRFERLDRKTKFIEADYIFDKEESFIELVPKLTPKITGDWILCIVDPSVSFLRTYVAESSFVPDFVQCVLYVPSNKLDAVAEVCPDAEVKEVSMWDAFVELVRTLKHPMSTGAYRYLYKAIGPNYDELKVALHTLDSECENETITLIDVRRKFTYTKRVYAQQVLDAFLKQNDSRWQLYATYERDLGIQIAYYALRKQVVKLLRDKKSYLSNVDVKNPMVHTIDASAICYVYTLFMNSVSPYQLPAILHRIDDRSQDIVERILEC